MQVRQTADIAYHQEANQRFKQEISIKQEQIRRLNQDYANQNVMVTKLES